LAFSGCDSMIRRFPLNGHGVPPCWRAYFLLLRQKKVAKGGVHRLRSKKATPRSAPLRGSLRYSAGRAAAELGLRPQTVLADCPRPACVAQRLPRGPKTSRINRHAMNWRAYGQPEKTPKNEILCLSVDALPGPLRGAEQRRNVGGSRRALFEGRRPELRSRPTFRVAQGTGQRPAPTQGWPFLWLLSFGHTKESTLANKAKPQAH
jgi:hypothetical protein